MKALVVGYGSAGVRHARVLAGLGLDVAVVSRRAVDAPRTYASIAEAVDGWAPDYVVVASRTGEHRGDMATLAGTGFSGKVLVEKPLFHRVEPVPDHAFAEAFVGFNLRFHPVIGRLKERLDAATPAAVHAYVGQYLPEWRPGRDYRESYSAHRDQGGGVLRDLCHELDYLGWMLGGWRALTALGGRHGSLEIASDDVFSVLMEMGRCPVVTAHMTYLASEPRREIVALTDEGSIRADLIAGTVRAEGRTERLETDADQTYIAEHRAVLEGDDARLCTLAEGLEVMRMIEAAERAAQDKTWVAA